MAKRDQKATPESVIALCNGVRSTSSPDADLQARHLRSLTLSGDIMGPAWRSLERRGIPAAWYAEEAAYIAASLPDWWRKPEGVRKARVHGIIKKLRALREAMHQLPCDWYVDASDFPQVPGPLNFIVLEELLRLYGDKPSGDDCRRNGLNNVRWTAIKLTELLIREANQPMRGVVARTIKAIFDTECTEADVRRYAPTR